MIIPLIENYFIRLLCIILKFMENEDYEKYKDLRN